VDGAVTLAITEQVNPTDRYAISNGLLPDSAVSGSSEPVKLPGFTDIYRENLFLWPQTRHSYSFTCMGDGRDPHAPKFDLLRRTVLEGPGHLDPAIRRAAASGSDVPEALAFYVDKVARHAYKVVDGDIKRLGEAGYSEDEIYEITIATALGQGLIRLEAGLAALAAAESEAPTESHDLSVCTDGSNRDTGFTLEQQQQD
jgi:hypothetical protein